MSEQSMILSQLVRDAGKVGLIIDIVDAALRAAAAALSSRRGTQPAAGVTLEIDGRQIPASGTAGLSIGAARRMRLKAQDSGADAAGEQAAASLLVLQAARAAPVSLPLLPGRDLRLVLVISPTSETARALLCANPSKVTEAEALDLLGSFASALEQPLALMA